MSCVLAGSGELFDGFKIDVVYSGVLPRVEVFCHEESDGSTWVCVVDLYTANGTVLQF